VNIVIVTQFYPPDTGGGGIAAYARYIAMGLRKRGHHIRVISRLENSSSPFEIIEGIEIHRIPATFKSYKWRLLPILGRQIRFLRDVLYALSVRKKLLEISRESLPDIVEYADIDAEGLFHPSICPRVVKLHTPHSVLKGYYTPQEIPYALDFIEQIESRSINKADGISSPSYYLAKEITSRFGINESRIKWVQNPIDTDYFSQCSNLSTNGNKTILFVGRIEPRKGAVVFAEAIPKIADLVPASQFILLGADRVSANGNSQKEELEAFFLSEGVLDRVQFHGHAAPDVFLKYYCEADIFVMPSLFENCPYTLLEAMSCGKPVVVNNVGGMPEIVENGVNGILFDAEDPNALSETVIELLRSPELQIRLGKAARQTILDKFSLDVGAQATEAFYEEVIAKYGSI